jgi:patatin-like phospholipase
VTDRGTAPSAEPYSPQRRTALLLTGTGTAGAYHAGVLRALHEAGVKLDVVSGHGIGVVGALFAAVDGVQKLWDDRGFWRTAGVRELYPWRPTLKVVALALILSVALVALPLAAMAGGLVVFPIDFALKMIGLSAASGLAERYLRFAASAFAPEGLPTWLPRLVVLVLGTAGAVATVGAWLGSDPRRQRGRFWWRILRPPLSAASAIGHFWSITWDLLRGAAQLTQPAREDLARRYIEVLSENLGQPGFRELLVAVHDLDARRDLIFALVNERRRRDLVRRPTTEEADARRAELVDLSGIARDHLPDAVAAALAIPIVTDPHSMTFAPDAYWRGETHRVCDRPACASRLVAELARLDVEQVVLVSSVSSATGPHTLAPPRIDGKGRISEFLQSSEAAIVRDLSELNARGGPRIFTIQPAHNPIGVFDLSGGFDDRSDRSQPLDELMAQGYTDAYHQFIEPVVGASGERVGQHSSSRAKTRA